MDGRSSERGSILLLVVWVVAVLAVLAAILSVRTKVFIRNAACLNGRTAGHLALDGGIQRALYDLLVLPVRKDLEPEEKNRTRFEYDIDGETVTVELVPVASKLSLQKVRQQVWKEIFMSYGKSEEEALAIIAAIQDWVDRDDLLHPGGAEINEYQSLPFAYVPHNDKIVDIRELLLIQGIDEEMYYGSDEHPPLTDFFTEREAPDRMDINTAPAALVQVLTQATEEEMDAFLEAREARAFANMQEVAEVLGPDAFTRASRHFTTGASADIMTLRATMKKGRQTISLEETYQISGRTIRWLERREWN